MKLLRINLRTKIIVSILGVVLIISLLIALITRYIIVASLTGELEQRGLSLAGSIAERGAPLILENKDNELLALIYEEAHVKERKGLIAYIFVLDRQGGLIAHTFVRPFPGELFSITPLVHGQPRQATMIVLNGREILDVAVPATEGIYHIGTVHVGMNSTRVEILIAKLRIIFLAFISAVILIVTFVSYRLARHITRPLADLTRVSDELSRGNFDIDLNLGHDQGGVDVANCPAYQDTELPCWHFDQTDRSESGQESPRTCRTCVFYSKREGDEVVQLADSFRNMVFSIRLYRKRLFESEEKYRSLFDSAPDPHFVVDTETLHILDANPRAGEMYGYEPEEFTGMPLTVLAPNLDAEGLSLFGYGLHSGCAHFPKVIHYKKDQRPFYVNMHACSTTYKGKAAIIMAVTDITDIMEKDAQLIQAAKMKSLGEMSAGMAHEINQPLNAIKIGAEFLAMVAEQGLEVSKEHYLEVVNEIGIQVDRASDIITTMRAFGRKADMDLEEVDLNEPVRAVLTILKKQFELENIIFDIDLARNLPKVKSHSNRLQQVLVNLIINARDAMAEWEENRKEEIEKRIFLRTYPKDDMVCIEVRDTGPGIPDSVRDKIFEPFFTTKKTGRGMGLGLAITYGIIKDYGGQISIKSGEGEGTAFTLIFPAAA